MWLKILLAALLVVFVVFFLFVGIMLARKWKSQYAQALANKAEYHQLKAANDASAGAIATASGNTVTVVHGDLVSLGDNSADTRSIAPGTARLWIPRPVPLRPLNRHSVGQKVDRETGELVDDEP